jgi:hypothetical protein
MISRKLRISPILALTSLIAILSPLQAREFVGRNGKKIEAEIVSKNDKEVELKLADGKTLKVPLASLSDADQLFVKVWESPEDKKLRLATLDPAEILAAKGFVPFSTEMKEGNLIVTLQIDGKEAKFLVDHRNGQPVLHQPSVEKLGLTMKPSAGGGQVVGTVNPEKISNGEGTVKGVEFLVAALNGIPEGIDGLIGGQTFVDWEAYHDFTGSKIWIKGE